MPTIFLPIVEGDTDEQAKYVPASDEWYTRSPRIGKLVDPDDGRIGISDLLKCAFITVNIYIILS
jgi:hypothetical protein